MNSIAKLCGVTGLSAVAFLGMMKPAEAIVEPVLPGIDYLETPAGGATFFFDDPMFTGFVEFEGLPIHRGTLGTTDTIVERKDEVPASGGTTDIEILDLSLKSVAPVNGFDVFATLTDSTTSLGTMDILPVDHDGGTWDSEFTIHVTAIIAPEGLFDPEKGGKQGFSDEFEEVCDPAPGTCMTIDFKKTFTASNEPWTYEPEPGDVIKYDSSNFFLSAPALHDAGDGTIHVVDQAVPFEHNAGLGLLVLGGWFVKTRRQKHSRSKLNEQA